MPIYDYECPECGEIEEVFQRSTEEEPRECPHFPECMGSMRRSFSSSVSLRVVGGTPRHHKRNAKRRTRRNYHKGGLDG